MNEIARETLEVQDRGSYRTAAGTLEIGAAQRAAVAGTRLFRPAELASLLTSGAPGSAGQFEPTFAVTAERTQDAARRLVEEEGAADLVLLNFASARNVGGGFLNGARAQEEDLARSSGLYRCLETQPEYYDVNRRTSSLLYTDHIIYSPGVPWFRAGSREFLERPFCAAVITAPAPNAGQYLRRDDASQSELMSTLVRRAGYVLAVAEARAHRTLLLGAWGCGVFRNRPQDVAEAFMSQLEQTRFRHSFRRIEFAVYDPAPGQPNLTAFRQRFEAAVSE
jgi:uncharacterized protein (TIGR02452 family)